MNDDDGSRPVVALTAGEPIATQRDATQNAVSVDLRLDEASTERRRVAHAVTVLTRVVLLFCALTIIIGGANYIQVRDQNKDAATSRTSIQENTDRTKDCTDPTGKCFKESQARLDTAIAQLNAYNRLSVGCAKAIAVGTPPDVTLAAIDRCIAARTPKAKPAQ